MLGPVWGVVKPSAFDSRFNVKSWVEREASSAFKTRQIGQSYFSKTGVVSLIFCAYNAATTQRGLVAEWLRRGLQILASQFDSGRGLQSFKLSELRRQNPRGGQNWDSA